MEALLKQILARLDTIETEMKSGFDNLDQKFDRLAHEGQEDVKGMIELIDKKMDERIETKLDRILSTQAIQGESINILALQQLHTASNVEALKKAK